MDKVKDLFSQAGSLLNSNEGIIIAVIGLLLLLWLFKKMMKMVLGLAFIGALIYYLTNYM